MLNPATEEAHREALVIAIDGPSGVGKSTAARLVASMLQIPYLDTGAMYRCLALHALRVGRHLDDSDASVDALLDSLRLELRTDQGKAVLLLDGEDVGSQIRSPQISEITSRFAARPRVRLWMVALQQTFGALYGGVVEGRDIGTVVFPQTPFKFFLDASPEVRAERRFKELSGRHPELTLEEVARSMALRDRRDSDRAASPLARTVEHILVDTATADADAIASRIVAFVKSASVGEC